MTALSLDARVVRSYGATEVFPPEDADVIVDNTATGATLAANHLAVVDELMRSSTRLYANPEALADPTRRAAAERLVLLVGSVLEARRRVMVEVNVTGESLARVRTEREGLARRLAALGAEPLPSRANFVLARFADAAAVRLDLARRGLAVRGFPAGGELESWLRITLPGDPAPFARLERALVEVLS